MDPTAFQFSYCPTPPDWRLDFDALVSAFDVLPSLADTPQDPVHHAEGNVLTHLRMVLEALVALPQWRALPSTDRHLTFTAAVFHDVAKPRTTRLEEGRVTSPKHALIGSRVVRRLLWSHPAFADDPPALIDREQVAALVRFHGLPLRFVDKPDPRRAVLAAATTARHDLLAVVARADVLGRTCADPRDLVDRIGLFESYCREQLCWTRPRAFASEHSRFDYFARGGADPDRDVYDDTRCTVTLLSGLPAAGKDAWCRANAADRPVISLDAVRADLDVDPADDQSAVVAAAKEQAKACLRARQDFIWNATNVSLPMRQQLIRLFDAYYARVEIVYLDAPGADLAARNRRRQDPVPAAVYERLWEKLDVPDTTEAHAVTWLDTRSNRPDRPTVP